MDEPTKVCIGCDRNLPLSRFNRCGKHKALRTHRCKRCLGRLKGQQKAYTKTKLSAYIEYVVDGLGPNDFT